MRLRKHNLALRIFEKLNKDIPALAALNWAALLAHKRKFGEALGILSKTNHKFAHKKEDELFDWISCVILDDILSVISNTRDLGSLKFMKIPGRKRMVFLDEKKFVEWNEAMSIKHNPDFHHNHPNPLMRIMENKRTTSILSYLEIEQKDKVLDVGCGAGNMLERVGKGKLYGIDLSAFALGLAKSRLNNNAILQKGNAESLPYKSNSFDKLFCSEVIEHTLHPERIIDEMHRVLNPEGVCVISIPNEKLSINIKKILRQTGLSRFILPANKGDESKIYDVCEWHLHVFSLGSLRKMVKEKFEITHKKGIPFGFIPVKYVVRLKKII